MRDEAVANPCRLEARSRASRLGGMQVASTERLRARELSATAFRKLAFAAAVSLYVIVISGAVVRLTGSGLGCESWPGCQAGSFFPASSHHAFVEFGNRVVALFPITLSLLAWLGATRTRGLPRWVPWTALATFAGTIAQAPLGFVTIYFDLHPLLVLAHFLLALLVLAGAVVVALEAWGNERGLARTLPPRFLRRAGLALAAACLALVVTGTLVTAAGPHSGGADVRRFGVLSQGIEVHVAATAVFGVLFAGVLVALARRRANFPGLFKAAAVVLALLLAQMAVGELQWRTQLPWEIVLVHVALAGAVWAGIVALASLLLRPVAPLVREPT